MSIKNIKLLFLCFFFVNLYQNLFCQKFILSVDSLNLKLTDKRIVPEFTLFTVLTRNYSFNYFKINDSLNLYYNNRDIMIDHNSYDHLEGFMIKAPQNYLIYKSKFLSDISKSHQIIQLDKDKKIKSVLHFKAGNLIGVSLINYFDEEVIELFCLIYSQNIKYTISKMNIFDLLNDGFAEKLYFDYNHLGANNSYIQTFTKGEIYDKYFDIK